MPTTQRKRTTRTTYSLRMFLFLVLAASSAFGQTPLAQDASTPQPAASRADPSPASVLRFLALDQNGNPVTDLRAEDLSLRVGKRPQKILSLSPASSEPRTIGIFFDNSGSRRSDPLVPQEVQSISKFLESNWRPRDAGFVILFDETPFSMAKATSDLSAILAALQKVPYVRRVGSTALYDALFSVTITGPQTGRGEKLYIVVGDFEDNSSHRSEQKMLEAIRDEHIRIFPLLRLDEDFPHTRDARHATQIARQVAARTGGDLLAVSKAADLDNAFRRLTSELQSSYLLTYAPSSTPESKSNGLQLETSRGGIDLMFPKD
jgi:VWFA-related protein